MHEVKVKSILSAANSMNIYRGCLHGCIYCDSRSSCYQMNHEFEDIEVKINAPELLGQALRRKRALCMIKTGSMSDPYLPLERRYKLTRECLKLIEQYGYGVSLLTKSDLVLRDLDLLKAINEKAKAVVQLTITTFDDELCRIVEPGVCVTSRRFEVLKTLNENGIATVVWLTPLLPFINDNETNIRYIVRECARAGVYGILTYGLGMTLREGNREYYYARLDEHFPGLKEEYIRRYGNDYFLPADKSDKLMAVFLEECRRFNIETSEEKITAFLDSFEKIDSDEQLSLF